MAENSTGKERSLLGIVPKGVSGLKHDFWSPTKSHSGLERSSSVCFLEVHESSFSTELFPAFGMQPALISVDLDSTLLQWILMNPNRFYRYVMRSPLSAAPLAWAEVHNFSIAAETPLVNYTHFLIYTASGLAEPLDGVILWGANVSTLKDTRICWKVI